MTSIKDKGWPERFKDAIERVHQYQTRYNDPDCQPSNVSWPFTQDDVECAASWFCCAVGEKYEIQRVVDGHFDLYKAYSMGTAMREAYTEDHTEAVTLKAGDGQRYKIAVSSPIRCLAEDEQDEGMRFYRLVLAGDVPNALVSYLAVQRIPRPSASQIEVNLAKRGYVRQAEVL